MFGIGTKKARLHVDAFVNMLGEDNQVHLPIPLLHRREHRRRIKIKKKKVVHSPPTNFIMLVRGKQEEIAVTYSIVIFSSL